MSRCRRSLWSAVVVAMPLAVWPASALAQADSVGMALFERGLARMEAGDYDSGCPALRESLRVSPRVGTLFTVAECEARWGKQASALAHYDEYLIRFDKMTAAEKRKQRARETIARKKLAELKRTVPHLVVRSAEPLPAGVTLSVDDVELGGGSLGLPLPMDPGKHVVRLRGESAAFDKEVSLDGSRTVEVDLPAAKKEPVVPPPPAPAEAAPIEPAASAAPPPRAPSSSRSTLTWTLAIGGGIATVSGVALGVLAMGQKSTVDGHCEGHLCDAEGKAGADRAQDFALASTVVTGVGLVAVGAAAVLWLTGPSRRTQTGALSARPTAWLGRGQGIIGLEGGF